MNLNRFMEDKAQALKEPQVDPSTSCNSFAALPDGHIPEGRRNTVMSRIAGRLVKRYGDTHEARGIFLERAKCCVPPLDENELDGIWSSAAKFGKAVSAQPGYVPPEEYNNPTPCKPDDYSDVGQAYAFAKHCRNYVRYSTATDYIVYDGVCWQESKPRSQAAMQQFTDTQLAEAEAWLTRAEERLKETGAKAVIAAHGKNASEFMTEEQKSALFAQHGAVAYRKFVLQRRDSKYQVAALREARPMVEIDHGELDKDGFLLNTPEYTVDLRKGMNGKQVHCAEDFITKCTAVSPGSRGADLWKDALHTFFCGDAELKEYVQRIAGLALIGHVYIEALIIAHGDGRNGKSTFWNVLARVMGSYSGNISADALTVGCKRNVKPELAETKGKRLLIAAELEEGMRLNTSVVKQFCSTDEIFAEKKYKDPFAFTPTHTLVLYTNHLPKVGANDPGTWRRLIVVPFNARIDGSGDVKNYADYLFDNAGSAVLAWMIEGAEKVISDNFRIAQPECVKKATALYWENSDWLSHFLEECCEVGDTYSERSGDLYAAYRSFCGRSGEYTRSTTDFYAAVDTSGFERKHTKKGRIVLGLRLKSEFASVFAADE